MGRPFIVIFTGEEATVSVTALRGERQRLQPAGSNVYASPRDWALGPAAARFSVLEFRQSVGPQAAWTSRSWVSPCVNAIVLSRSLMEGLTILRSDTRPLPRSRPASAFAGVFYNPPCQLTGERVRIYPFLKRIGVFEPDVVDVYSPLCG